MKKANTLLISFFLGLPLFVFALEIKYPALPGTSSPITLVRFVNYVFVFLIFLGVVIAILQLVLAGAKFIWGSTNPNIVKDARDQALKALLGLAILLASYLILATINPQLIHIFSLPPLKSFPKTLPPPEPQDAIFRGDLMERIKKMVREISALLSNVEKTATDIKKATDDCQCSGAISLCSCDKPGKDAVCKPQKCYVTKDNQPCKEPDKIKENQMKIVSFLNAILYYKNRSEKEIEDLRKNIGVIDKKIKWYDDSIKTAQENEKKAKTPSNKNFWRKMAEDLKKGREKSIEERARKEIIANLIEEVKRYLDSFQEPLKTITELPEKCLSEVENKCRPVCKDKKEEGYGCYEAILGCQPDNCKGGNPCPQEEIIFIAKNINSLVNNANGVLGQIIPIINFIQGES